MQRPLQALSPGNASESREQHLECKIEREARLCGIRKNLLGGKALHRKAVEAGCHKTRYIATALISMYSKCGSMKHAREVFEDMTHSDVVSWNVLILGYVENGESSVAMELLKRMNCAPNRVTFVAALKACVGLETEKKLDRRSCIQRGLVIYKQATEYGLDQDIFVSNTLLDTFTRFGSILHARDHFDKMIHRDLISWNILIQGYVENGECVTALEMFSSMDYPPNRITFVAALKACTGMTTDHRISKETCLQKGLAVHKRAKAIGVDKSIRVANTLVDMYSKFGQMKLARDCFNGMLRRDVVSWNILILGYVESGEFTVALEMFDRMDCAPTCLTFVAALRACAGWADVDKTERKSSLQKGMVIHRQVRERRLDKDLYVANTLIDMYSKCGEMVEAREVFDGMEKRHPVAWTSLILGYVDNGESSMALSLLNTLDEFEPDSVIFIAALKACGSLGAVEAARRIHSQVCRLGYEEEPVVNSLLDFYGKCGRMTCAEVVFSTMFCPSVVSWTSLTGGYSSLGSTSHVFRLVEGMVETGVRVNGVTMLLILTACRHAGMVEEGRKEFESMWKYGLSPSVEHYACMVDMLGRGNRLEEALALVKSMPFQGDSVVWMSLLGACRNWSDMEVGMKNIFHRLGMEHVSRGHLSTVAT